MEGGSVAGGETGGGEGESNSSASSYPAARRKESKSFTKCKSCSPERSEQKEPHSRTESTNANANNSGVSEKITATGGRERLFGRLKLRHSCSFSDDTPAGPDLENYTITDSSSSPEKQQSFPKRRLVVNLPVVQKWRNILKRAMSLEDPWELFRIESFSTQECLRHRYSSLRKQWVTDTVQIKMEPEPFGRGAMRECYRMKKLSNIVAEEWCNAQNYVAKRYIVDVPRNTYFEDVRLQMDAKLWGEEFNRHNPPKKIDVFQMSVLEFVNLPDKPLFHLEHFIEGDYIKYNSNSGFVENCDSVMRQTPQAFSHFTFERSGHQLIVVDVQGVGDLYTDPQIHTADGKGYGDGNLGTKGMSLFFHSHVCNSICQTMALTPFDLSATELASLQKFLAKTRINSETRCRGSEELCQTPAFISDRENAMKFVRSRCLSSSDIMDEGSGGLSGGSPLPGKADSMELCGSTDDVTNMLYSNSNNINSGGSPGSPVGIAQQQRNCSPFSRNVRYRHSIDYHGSDSGSVVSLTTVSESESLVQFEATPYSPTAASAEGMERPVPMPNGQFRRARYSSDIDSGCSTVEQEEEAFWLENRKRSRPSCYAVEVELRELERLQEIRSGGSILGQIHLDMARYHELGRFLIDEGQDYDRAAAWFHLEIAADCGVMEAILTAAKIYLGHPHDLLADFCVDDDEENIDRGFDYMEMAARRGDRSAMLHLANAFDSGEGLGTERDRSWQTAVYWFEKAAEMEELDESGEYDATGNHPKYLISARLAELFRSGGFGLSVNCEKAAELYCKAAEEATEAMKGKLASRYYCLAEEVSAVAANEE